ncbi:MAG: cytochrome c [Acidobacteriota bacterium]|nr:cytochrome c [Acidobacteriota bacterium]
MKLITALSFPLLLLAAGWLPAGRLAAQSASTQNKAVSKELIDGGKSVFQQQCAFCHGRDAAGGETGPSLVDSELVKRDKAGTELAGVIREGRPEKGMPKFDLAGSAMDGLIAFIHTQEAGNATNGKRRGVLPADLQTGNAAQGRKYFEGQGGCATCHSPTGDLAHVGTRLIGLKLEQRMLYPDRVKAKGTVTLPQGKSFTGEVAYNDEFTIALRDAAGQYRSWPKIPSVQVRIDAPAEAHAELLGKYTDADIHNLMAYLQTLK